MEIFCNYLKNYKKKHKNGDDEIENRLQFSDIFLTQLRKKDLCHMILHHKKRIITVNNKSDKIDP